jgi:hypothetical protein
LLRKSRGFQADGLDERVQIVDDTLVEAVKLGSPPGVEAGVLFDVTEKACREWRVDTFEQLQED